MNVEHLRDEKKVSGVYQVSRSVVKLSGKALQVMQDLLASVRNCILLAITDKILPQVQVEQVETHRVSLPRESL